MGNNLDDFQAYRQKMNDRILSVDNLEIKRFFNLDTAAYRSGAIEAKTKELLSLLQKSRKAVIFN